MHFFPQKKLKDSLRHHQPSSSDECDNCRPSFCTMKLSKQVKKKKKTRSKTLIGVSWGGLKITNTSYSLNLSWCDEQIKITRHLRATTQQSTDMKRI